MHYHAEVWVQKEFLDKFPDSLRLLCVQDAVTAALAPYDENDCDDNSGWWDWYQIGGRWTGTHVPGYDPNTDPENIENGSVKWPTSWVHFTGDIMKVEELPKLLNCFTLVIKDQVEQKKAWNGEDFVTTDFDGLVVPRLKQLGIFDGYLVTVDYHS